MLSDASRASHGLYLRQGAKETPSERKSERAGCKSSTVLTTAHRPQPQARWGSARDRTPRSIEHAARRWRAGATGDRAA